MTDPKRWIDEGGGATPFERDLLRDALNMDPPTGAQASAWAALILRIDPGGGGPGGDSGAGQGLEGGAQAGGATGAAASNASALSTATGLGAVAGGGIVKSAVLGAACAGVALASYIAVTPSAPGPSAAGPSRTVAVAPIGMGEPGALRARGAPAPIESAPAVSAPSANPASGREGPKGHVSAASRAPPLPEVGPEPAPPIQEVVSPAGSSGAASLSVSERASRLRDESLLLGQARDALRGGSAGEALRLLEVSRTRFPDGMLGQEREALTIEALARGGHRAAAAARAAAFIRAYPQSPHAQRLQSFTQ